MGQEWTKQFNFLVCSVKRNKGSEHSQELEIKFKGKYDGIFKETNKGDLNIDNSGNEDSSSDEDVDAYDGFAGDDTVSESIEESVLS